VEVEGEASTLNHYLGYTYLGMDFDFIGDRWPWLYSKESI
jgi:hypothetical protein